MEKISNKSFVQKVLEKLQQQKPEEVLVCDSYSAPVFRDEYQSRLNRKIKEESFI